MFRVAVNRLRRVRAFGVHAEWVSRVWVAIKPREVAAGDFQTDAMALFEEVAGDPQIDSVLLDCFRLKEFGLGHSFAKASAEYSLAEIEGATIRIDIDEFSREIGVLRS